MLIRVAVINDPAVLLVDEPLVLTNPRADLV
jgi:hypothetical protein